MRMDLPHPEWVNVDLVSDWEPVLGRALPEEDVLGGRLRVELIQPRRLTPSTAGNDEELKHFMEAEQSQFEYHLIRVACTFIDDEREPFERAWVKVELSREGHADDLEYQPIAWSLEPKLLAAPSGIVKTVEITDPLKLVTYRREQEVGNETYLKAKYASTQRPTWYLTRTTTHAIDGDHDLRVVVRAPTSTQGLAEVSLGATTRRKMGGVVPRIARLPEGCPVRARFGASNS